MQSLQKAFQRTMKERGIIPDAAQKRAIERLHLLYVELLNFKNIRANTFKKILMRPRLPRGLYFWGGVGRGKSFLMDCFFETVPYIRKRRIHFHAFMQEIHGLLKQLSGQADPLIIIAKGIAQKTRLLCFDEFHVADIADAMMLGRLMEALFEHGVVFCMTSNYPPDGLYPNGLQRHHFVPTITLLKNKLDILEVDSGVDYRLRYLETMEVYHVPIDVQGEARLAEDFLKLAGKDSISDSFINILDRKISVKRQCHGVIWFDFEILCGGMRSQNDYLELARCFHTLLLSGVPCMTVHRASEARRFTWLVDVLYDHKVKFLLTAECEAHELYREGPHAHEFTRTISRLIEMRSRAYLGCEHQ